MDHDDYETLPSNSLVKNMTAGATAGVLEHCIMYPMDSVKTRMQSLSPVSSGQTIVSTYRNMVLKEGWLRPVRGMGAVVAGAGPAHALYFATYEYSKEVSQSLFPNHRSLCIMTSAVTATLIHDAISNPAEVIKQRLQMYNSPYRSIVQCARGVWATEGVRAFYRSYNTQLLMNLPYQNIHFATYECIQNLLNTDHKYNPPVHMLAGALAGGAASAITTPLDVVKTLLNTQETGVGLTRGMREACKQIYAVAGVGGFFKGLYARVLYAMPATAICWSTYEFAKFVLSHQTRDEYQLTQLPQQAQQPHVPHISTKDVLAGAAAEVRLDEKIRLSYVLPSTQAAPAQLVAHVGGSSVEQVDDGEAAAVRRSSSSSSTTSSSEQVPTPPSTAKTGLGGSGSLLPRELPSMSGAGVYSSALSLNTMHTTEASRFAESRGCSN